MRARLPPTCGSTSVNVASRPDCSAHGSVCLRGVLPRSTIVGLGAREASLKVGPLPFALIMIMRFDAVQSHEWTLLRLRPEVAPLPE